MVSFTLHAGLHKTATTSLQEHVFPNVKGVHYTGKSRYVMSARHNPGFISHFNKTAKVYADMANMMRLPLHECCHLLSIIQDQIVLRLARDLASDEALPLLFRLNRELLKAIEEKCEAPHVLYSCEGLLLSAGHLNPRLALHKNLRDSVPLAAYRDLFPGTIKRVVIYMRSPLDYLFSRYMQVHQILYGGVGKKAKGLDVDGYLELNTQLWIGDTPSQSVFHHIFQSQLVDQIRLMGLPIVARSYEEHICGEGGISQEIEKGFGLEVANPKRVDRWFRDLRLNTADDKDTALKHLLRISGCKDRAELKDKFMSLASSHPLVKQAMQERLFANC